MGGGRVLHHDLPASSFARRDAPPGPETRRLFGLLKSRQSLRVYREAAMALELATSLPAVGFPPGLSEDRQDEYADLLELLNVGHRLLGHPYLVQGPLEQDCESWTGVPAKDWRLLLQIDTDEKNSDMMWGDCGMLYWWIPAEDAPAGRFDRVVTLAQWC